MPRLSIPARRRIISLISGGFCVPSIVQRLEQEKVVVSKCTVYNLMKKFRLKGAKDLPRRRKARILTYIYSMHGYIPRMDTLHMWLYSTHGYIPRMDLLHAWLYSMRGSTRDVYVPCY